MSIMKPLGRHPLQQRLERIRQSRNYQNGSFQNINPTPMSREGVTMVRLAFEFFLKKKIASIKPTNSIPVVRTDLKQLSDSTPTIVWFGHSSYLIKYQDKNILVDPVFCGHASPMQNVIRAFPGTDLYQFQDFPKIDLLLITHDHYDHLDFKTVSEFQPTVEKVIMPLGVGEHLEHWGYESSKLTELDWWESTKLSDDIRITATPARHFSGRGFKRSSSLWASFVLELGTHKIFIGGDSGYDEQFMKIGDLHGPFDLAILECGQYNENWPYIHMFPEETAQAAADLKAKVLFPVHWGKFVLAQHAWTDSIERVSAKARELKVQLTTPRIGEPLILDGKLPQESWWSGH